MFPFSGVEFMKVVRTHAREADKFRSVPDRSGMNCCLPQLWFATVAALRERGKP
jgi:hypothetical protein